MRHKIVRHFGLLLLGLTFIVNSSRGQSADTIQYRLELAYLGDSTAIQYEIGSFALGGAGSVRYLSFLDTSGITPTHFFKTQYFTVGSSDTISFGRFASFYSSGVSRAISYVDSADQYDSAAMWYCHHWQDQPTPDTTYFSNSSTVLFIVELRRASDDVVLQRLDTIECYTDVSGHLRAQHLTSSFNQRNDLAITATPGTVAYFDVETVRNLPSSGSFIGYDYTLIDRNGPARGRYAIATPYEVNLPTAVPKSPRDR